jgi:hypothetical protein
MTETSFIKFIKSIRIKSNTFIHKELEVNDDTRSLGIDVKSVSFPGKRYKASSFIGP